MKVDDIPLCLHQHNLQRNGRLYAFQSNRREPLTRLLSLYPQRWLQTPWLVSICRGAIAFATPFPLSYVWISQDDVHTGYDQSKPVQQLHPFRTHRRLVPEMDSGLPRPCRLVTSPPLNASDC